VVEVVDDVDVVVVVTVLTVLVMPIQAQALAYRTEPVQTDAYFGLQYY
jgi:hypothetical protein